MDQTDYKKYDFAGNRLTRNVRVDLVNSGYADQRDQDYEYDGLDRLKDVDQGTASSMTELVTTKSFEQQWTLDQLGNWSEFKVANNGTGTFSGAANLDQDRSHNAANEITSITAASGQVDWDDPEHDAAGNMSPGESYLELKYDAWNRATETYQDLLGTIAEFEYDGLGQRIRKDLTNASYDYYYNDQWQLLTEVKDGAEKSIYHWHPFYIDALAARMRASDTHFFLADANFNVTAAVDDNGNAVVERYAYSAYGVPLTNILAH